ncbi:protein kinase [bacterium]|nr:protein kinase [bacterium]
MAASLKVGDVLCGRYPILGILGEGGMGAVYQASDIRSPRVWAIKEMTEKFASEDERREAISGFEMEARLLSALEHPNLPRVTDFFSDRGHLYLVMDLVQGDTWEKIQSRGRQSADAILDIVWQITEVLRYLHNRPQPIIFRDLKPANVMITPEGVAKLIDFGIARVFQAGKATDTRALGTPGYAAPEQYGTGQSDARTDIYALGVMMHQAFSGIDPSIEPFQFASLSNMIPGFPKSLEDIVTRAVALDRNKRFANVAEMQEALKALHTDPDAYDLLPTRLRTGILPKPETRSFPQPDHSAVNQPANRNASAPSAGLQRESPYRSGIPRPSVSGKPSDSLERPSAQAEYAANRPLAESVNAPKAASAKHPAAGSADFDAAKLRTSTWPWISMGILFAISLIPLFGLPASLFAWLVVLFARGQRISMAICAIGIGITSVISLFAGASIGHFLLESISYFLQQFVSLFSVIQW